MVPPVANNTIFGFMPRSLLIGSPRFFEHDVQQHVAARSEVFRLGVLDLVVTDAAFAGHENHAGRRNSRHVDGVVASSADDVHVAQAQGLRRIAHRGYTSAVEIAGRVIGDALDARVHISGLRKPLAYGAHLAFHTVECLVLCGPGVHREAHLTRNDVARVWLDLHESHRAPAVRVESSGKAPTNTPEPIITGVKRDPSSLVHTATSTGASVRIL